LLDLTAKALKVDRTFITYTNGWTASRFNLPLPYFGKIAEEKGEVLVVNDVDKISGDKEEVKKHGINSFVLVPFNSHFGGHLGVASKGKREWSGWELTILQAAGKVVADIVSEIPAQQQIKNFENLIEASSLFKNAAPLTLSQSEGKYIPIIEGVATANPGPKVPQSECRDWIKNISSLRDMLHRVDALYENTKINTRHLANPDFSKPFDPSKFEFYPHSSDLLPLPPIQDRLKKFDEYAAPVVTKAAEDAMRNAGISVDQIGKLIFVTSTGFSGPGLDCHIIKSLGISPHCERALVGFMGCAAAMNGFRVACDYAVSHPDKKALMVSVEVSSVHGAFADNMNDMIIHALFADGCGAVIIGARVEGEAVPRPFGRHYDMEIITAKSWLVPGTEDGITLAIQNEGITCTLSRQLPQYIFSCAKKYVDITLEPLGFKQEDVDHWMIHPGGTRIIQSAAASLGLDDTQTAQSWAVF
jgi:alpha-pyrone synthase